MAFVDAVNPGEEDRLARRAGKFKKLCVTDPDVTMATSSAGRQLQPSYKQHTSVDDLAGVIVDIEIVTGEETDSGRMAQRLDAIETPLRRRPGAVTADKAYGIGKVCRGLPDRGIGAVIAPRPVTRRVDAESCRPWPRKARCGKAHSPNGVSQCPKKRP